ncbi:MAG: hypothetical protein HGB03_00600 [Candidatus Yonathbacteria bacterium]|nr:hypothetical protein [Candidatus Yonathbacteria bacterium]NTW47761.1 hypothetical protein [Candidatus Yonathbacteria bacterium]
MTAHPLNWQRYLLALVITGSVFWLAISISNRIHNERVKEIQSIENNISMNILSLETQFDLLAEVSCDEIDNTILSKELNSLAERLGYMEQQRGKDDTEVERLKEYYSLMQIKDYLLMKKIGKECGDEPVSILYFYSNEGDCPDCEKEGYVLTYLRENYPGVRVYAFDYHIGLSAVSTFTSMYNVTENLLPSVVIGKKTLYGFQEKETLESLLPESLKKPSEESTTEAGVSTKTSAKK